MDSSTNRIALRLTPIPDPDPTKSLIIKLNLSNTKETSSDTSSPPQKPSSNDLDPDYIPGQRKPSTHKAKQHPKSLQSLTKEPNTPPQATTISSPTHTSPYLLDFPSSPASSVSSASIEPEDPSYIALDALRVDAARDIVTMLYSWGRDEVRMELHEAIILQDAPADDAELLQKMIWVRECLRGRYKVWIQSYDGQNIEHHTRKASSKNGSSSGVGCDYPGCGRLWEKGECRVSFEPPELMGPQKAIEHITCDEEEDSTNKEEAAGEADEQIIPVPGYEKLMAPKNMHQHNRSEFYCLRCFEKLLDMPTSTPVHIPPPKKRKRTLTVEKYPRPSPLCRIYASVFAETRIHAGKPLLDAAAAEVVRRWKDGLFEKGIKGIMERFGEFFKGGEEEVKIEEGEEGDVNVGEGRGLAELLVGVKEAKGVRGSRVGPGRKKKRY